jgi:hypothetical protein
MMVKRPKLPLCASSRALMIFAPLIAIAPLSAIAERQHDLFDPRAAGWACQFLEFL